MTFKQPRKVLNESWSVHTFFTCTCNFNLWDVVSPAASTAVLTPTSHSCTRELSSTFLDYYGTHANASKVSTLLTWRSKSFKFVFQGIPISCGLIGFWVIKKSFPTTKSIHNIPNRRFRGCYADWWTLKINKREIRLACVASRCVQSYWNLLFQLSILYFELLKTEC